MTTPDKFSTKPGWFYGLQLELIVGKPNSTYSLGVTSGIHVLVHNKTEEPNYLLGLNANVGELTLIEVSRSFSSRMASPYSDCIQDIESYAQKSLYVRTILKTGYGYKQTDCYNVCSQKYIVQDCECYSPDFPFW